MNRPFYTFLIIFTFFFAAGFSQTGTIRGRVFNHKNNEPLPFTNIIIENDPQKGASSDTGGNFVLSNVKPGYVRLVAS